MRFSSILAPQKRTVRQGLSTWVSLQHRSRGHVVSTAGLPQQRHFGDLPAEDQGRVVGCCGTPYSTKIYKNHIIHYNSKCGCTSKHASSGTFQQPVEIIQTITCEIGILAGVLEDLLAAICCNLNQLPWSFGCGPPNSKNQEKQINDPTQAIRSAYRWCSPKMSQTMAVW
jgi:hypothetical protein